MRKELGAGFARLAPDLDSSRERREAVNGGGRTAGAFAAAAFLDWVPPLVVGPGWEPEQVTGQTSSGSLFVGLLIEEEGPRNELVGYHGLGTFHHAVCVRTRVEDATDILLKTEINRRAPTLAAVTEGHVLVVL